MNSTESRELTGPASTRPAIVTLLREPARSRMIDGFTNDILQLFILDRWDEAQRRAALVPMIAVALADRGLSVSRERYSDWCREWTDEESPAVIDEWYAIAAEVEGSPEGVPMNALLSLRLHRHLRAVDVRSLSALNAARSLPRASTAGTMCAALTKAMCTWYGQAGRQDIVVQQNLARLLVHR